MSFNKVLKNAFPQLAYFYYYLRYRIILLISTSLLVGLLDGLGITMFIPLLELVSNNNSEGVDLQMGNMSFIIDGLTGIGFKLTLDVVLIIMFIFFTLKGIFKWLEGYLNTIYQQFFIREIRIETIQALGNYDYKAFIKADAGRIQNILSGEVSKVAAGFRAYNSILQKLILTLTYGSLAFLSNPQFAVLVIIGGLASNFIFSSLYKKTKKLSKKLVDSNNQFQGLLIQQVAFFKYLNSTNKIRVYSEKLINMVYKIEADRKKIGIIDAMMLGLREPMVIGIVIVTILVEVYFLGGQLSTIILSLLFFYRGLSVVTVLQSNYNNFLRYSGSIDSMVEFINELKRNQKTTGGIRFSSFKNEIKLNGVDFSFGSNNVLKNINLAIRKNDTIALVGESGSGKTTLMNILAGILRPSNGEVIIDEINLKDYDIDSFQNKIGYITQEPVVFDDTVFNNITFWAKKSRASIHRLKDVLQKASLLNFIEGLESQLDSRLGNNGVSLSGGQKQRISIARELYQNVDFLFMDEATSALDAETERIIQRSIESLKGKLTIVIIAHRLSTIKNADKIVLMNNGEVIQISTYDELLKENKQFQKMVKLQEL